MKTTKVNKKSGISGTKMALTGAGLAAVGAGAYYFLGPKGKAHQKKASALMAKMKKEVASEIKKAKKVTAPVYHKAVDIVSAEYSRQYKAHEKEIKAVAKKLKSEWQGLATAAVKKAVSKKKRG